MDALSAALLQLEGYLKHSNSASYPNGGIPPGWASQWEEHAVRLIAIVSDASGCQWVCFRSRAVKQRLRSQLAANLTHRGGLRSKS